MNNKLIVFVFALMSSTIFAQKNVDSPYSNYGLGQLRPQATEENRLMGGIQVYADSIHLNFRNPAAYGDLKYTTYVAGVTLNKTKLSSSNQEVTAKNSTLDYMALGFPIAQKIGIGVGLIPYSSVGYKLLSIQDNNGQKVSSQYEGKGGINRAFLSAGYEIFKGFNVGVSLYANFGNVEMRNMRSEEGVQLATQEFSKSAIKGMNYRIGVSYKRKMSDKLTLMSSISYTPKTEISSNNSRVISTLEFSPQTGALIPRDVDNIDLAKYGLARTELTMPSELSLGFGVGEDKKWFAGVNYTYSGMKNFRNPFILSANIDYENAYNVSLGGFFIPKYNSFTGYWKRVAYRFGIRYENTGILLKNQTINDFGISFGLSLPLKGFSNATIGMEYGQRGTTTENLVKENYLSLRIGLSLNDRWFQKSKY